jgi:hypothetical protein
MLATCVRLVALRMFGKRNRNVQHLNQRQRAAFLWVFHPTAKPIGCATPKSTVATWCLTRQILTIGATKRRRQLAIWSKWEDHNSEVVKSDHAKASRSVVGPSEEVDPRETTGANWAPEVRNEPINPGVPVAPLLLTILELSRTVPRVRKFHHSLPHEASSSP